MILELTEIDFERVRFLLEDEDGRVRHVSVLVGSAQSWRSAMRFPHIADETGLSTGSDEVDAAIRRRAAEELVRLTAAVDALAARRAA